MYYCWVQAGWNDSLGWYGVLYTLHYFHFVFTLIHYTSSFTGKVVAILFPIRVSTSCGDQCLLYLSFIYISYVLLIHVLLISWQYGDCQQTYP